MANPRHKLKRRISHLTYQLGQLRLRFQKLLQKRVEATDRDCLKRPSSITGKANLDRAASLVVVEFDQRDKFQLAYDQLVLIEISLTNLRVLLEWFEALKPTEPRYGADPDDLMRYQIGKMFVLELWTIVQSGKELSKHCRFTAPSLNDVCRKFESQYPRLRILRNSMAHSEEMARRVGKIEGVQVHIGTISGDRIRYTAKDGIEDSMSISVETLTKVEMFVDELYALLPTM